MATYKMDFGAKPRCIPCSPFLGPWEWMAQGKMLPGKPLLVSRGTIRGETKRKTHLIPLFMVACLEPLGVVSLWNHENKVASLQRPRMRAWIAKFLLSLQKLYLRNTQSCRGKAIHNWRPLFCPTMAHDLNPQHSVKHGLLPPFPFFMASLRVPLRF